MTKSSVAGAFAVSAALTLWGMWTTQDRPYSSASFATSSIEPGVAIKLPRLAEPPPDLPRGASALPLVTLTRDEIYLGDEYVTGGPKASPSESRHENERWLSQLESMLVAARAATADSDVRESAVRVRADDAVLFGALSEVLQTILFAGYSRAYFVARSPDEAGTLRAIPWDAPPRPIEAPPFDHLRIDVLLVSHEGASIRADYEPLGPNCESAGLGIAVALEGAPGDKLAGAQPFFRDVAECVAKVRRSHREASSSWVHLSATPDTPIRLVYSAMLALSARPSATESTAPTEYPELGGAIPDWHAWQASPELERRRAERALREALSKASLTLGARPAK